MTRTSNLLAVATATLLPLTAVAQTPVDMPPPASSELVPEPAVRDAAVTEAPADAAPAPATTAAVPAESPSSALLVSAPVARTRTVGTVVGHRGNDAILDACGAASVQLGDPVRLYVEHPVDLGDGEIAYEREELGVGTVVAASPRRCLVRLGTNESAPVGAHGEVTIDEVPTARIAAPPRSGGYWEVGASTRIFLVNSALGGGSLTDGYVGYRGERPFFAFVRVDPSGFSVHRFGKQDEFHNAGAAGAVVVAGYDHRILAFGAGFGVTRTLREERSTSPTGDSTEPAAGGFTFALHTRLGPIDGWHVASDFSFTSTRLAALVSHLDMRVQIPFSERLALRARGGSGFDVTGASWVDVGARIRARGDGHSGTVFVTPFLGWASVSERAATWFETNGEGDLVYAAGESRDRRGGPSAGVAIELRL